MAGNQSGLSNYSKNSQKRSPSGFSDIVNLSAYQKRMTRPSDIFKDHKEAF